MYSMLQTTDLPTRSQYPSHSFWHHFHVTFQVLLRNILKALVIQQIFTEDNRTNMGKIAGYIFKIVNPLEKWGFYLRWRKMPILRNFKVSNVFWIKCFSCCLGNPLAGKSCDTNSRLRDSVSCIYLYDNWSQLWGINRLWFLLIMNFSWIHVTNEIQWGLSLSFKVWFKVLTQCTIDFWSSYVLGNFLWCFFKSMSQTSCSISINLELSPISSHLEALGKMLRSTPRLSFLSHSLIYLLYWGLCACVMYACMCVFTCVQYIHVQMCVPVAIHLKVRNQISL